MPPQSSATPESGSSSLPAHLTMKVLGAVPPADAWNDVLRTLAAWPAPDRIVLERRVVRCGRRRLEQQLVAGTDGVGILHDAARQLEALLRPLREHSALRAAEGTHQSPPAQVVLLPGLGTQFIGAAGGLASAALDDLLDLPAGAGVGLVVWRSPSLEPEELRLRVARLGPTAELHLLGVPSPPLQAALRVWSPSAIPAALLARLAALAGAPADAWRHLRHGAASRAAAEAVVSGTPPQIEDPDDFAVDVERLSRLLGEVALSPRPAAGAPIGRPFTGRTPAEGCELGRVLTRTGRLTRLRVPWRQRERHMLVCGRTGSGKSELIARLAADDLAEGRGLLLLDPHGDLADRVLAHVPEARRDDVVLIEPHDARTAAVPVLDGDASPGEQMAMLDDVFQELFGDAGFYTSRWRRPGRVALQMLESLEGVDPSVVGLDRVMGDDEVRLGLKLCLGPDDPSNRASIDSRVFWDRATMRGTALAESPGRNAFDHLPRWNLQDALARGAIVIARLDVGHLGTLDAGRIGRVLLRRAFAAMTALGSARRSPRPPLSIVVDEAHLFSSGPVLGALLAQSRKYGAGVTLCTQTPSRLPVDLRTDVMTNCATVLALQLPSAEASTLAVRDPAVPSQIAQLPKYHAVAMLDGDEGGHAPLVLHPLPPIPDDHERCAQAAETARGRHGRTHEAAQRGDLERFALLADAVGGTHLRSLGRRDAVDPARVAALVEATLAHRPLERGDDELDSPPAVQPA